MDEKTINIRKKHWGGKELPFTVLLDFDSKTEQEYGIDSHPTLILISPDGIVVGEISLKAFEEKLTPLPAIIYLERARDQHFNIAWHLDSKVKLSEMASNLSRWIGPEIKLDTTGLDEAGFSADSSLPVAVAATGHSIRGIELLTLEPLGLELRPDELDPKKLLLTKIKEPNEREMFAESDDLEKRNAELRKLLKSKMDAKVLPDETTSGRNIVQIENKSLFETIVLIEKELGVPVAVDTAALIDGSIPADLKINGKLDTKRQWASLRTLLEKNKLRAVVQYGVLFIKPARQK